MSVCVWTSIYYDFIPFEGHTPPKRDSRGRLIPDEAYGHARSHLNSTLDQQTYTSSLRNAGERNRKDIWWIEPSGTNAVEVVENIALSFLDQGIQWFNFHNDLEKCFDEIEKGHNCYVKFRKAMFFAKQLGLSDKEKMYTESFHEEGRRIGRFT